MLGGEPIHYASDRERGHVVVMAAGVVVGVVAWVLALASILA